MATKKTKEAKEQRNTKDIQLLATEFINTKSEEAYTQIVKRLTPGLHKHIMEIEPNQEKRKEIINDVFVKVWTKIHQYNPEFGAFSTWIYKIAYNDVLLSKRNSFRTTSIDGGNEDTTNVTLSPLNSIQYSYKMNEEFDTYKDNNVIDELYGMVKTMILNFPESEKYKNWKTAFLLKDIEGYQFNEVAELMNENENTVKGWVCKARRHLAKMTNKEDQNLVEDYFAYRYEYENNPY